MEITASLVKELREITGAGMMDCKKALSECDGDKDKAINYLREKGISKSAKKEGRIAAEGLSNIYVNGNNAVIIEVNSETDFVSNNAEFREFVDAVGKTILEGNANTLEEAKNLPYAGETLNDLIVAKTAKIGEKLSLRRFEKVTKTDDEHFGAYIHMGGRISVLTVVKGASEEVAKEVAMQAAAMKPLYVFTQEVPADVLDAEREVQRNIAINEGKPADIAEKMVEGRIKTFYEDNCLLNQKYVKDTSKTIEQVIIEATAQIGEKISVRRFVRYEMGEGLQKKDDNFAEEVMNQIK